MAINAILLNNFAVAPLQRACGTQPFVVTFRVVTRATKRGGSYDNYVYDQDAGLDDELIKDPAIGVGGGLVQKRFRYTLECQANCDVQGNMAAPIVNGDSWESDPFIYGYANAGGGINSTSRKIQIKCLEEGELEVDETSCAAESTKVRVEFASRPKLESGKIFMQSPAEEPETQVFPDGIGPYISTTMIGRNGQIFDTTAHVRWRAGKGVIRRLTEKSGALMLFDVESSTWRPLDSFEVDGDSVIFKSEVGGLFGISAALEDSELK